MWAGLSPFGGPTKTGLSDMIVRHSGRDHSPFTANVLCTCPGYWPLCAPGRIDPFATPSANDRYYARVARGLEHAQRPVTRANGRLTWSDISRRRSTCPPGRDAWQAQAELATLSFL